MQQEYLERVQRVWPHEKVLYCTAHATEQPKAECSGAHGLRVCRQVLPCVGAKEQSLYSVEKRTLQLARGCNDWAVLARLRPLRALHESGNLCTLPSLP